MLVTFKNDSIIQVADWAIELPFIRNHQRINLFIDIEKTLKNGLSDHWRNRESFAQIDYYEHHPNVREHEPKRRHSAFRLTTNQKSSIWFPEPIWSTLRRRKTIWSNWRKCRKFGRWRPNDKKKSEVLLSGKLDNTPTYKDTKRVRSRIRSVVSGGYCQLWWWWRMSTTSHRIVWNKRF